MAALIETASTPFLPVLDLPDSQPTMSASRTDLDSLSAAAELLRDNLKRSQVVTDNMVRILGSFDRRLSSLEVTVLPIQLHTRAFRIAHQNIEKTLAAAESILSQFDVTRKVEARISGGPREDLVSYLAAVDQLLENVECFSYNKSSDAALNFARSVLSAAMDKLSEEFCSLLVRHSKSEDPAKLSKFLEKSQAFGAANGNSIEITSSEIPGAKLENLPLVLIPSEVILNLQEMTRRLIAAAHIQQCLQIYSKIRASSLEQTLQKLGFEKLTKDEVQMLQWEHLEGKIRSWNLYMCIVVKVLYAAERDLCNEVFCGMDPYQSQCFLKVTTNSFSNLLSTGNAISQSKRSPEKLFAFLDMYETMHDLLPEIEVIFYGSEAYSLLQAAVGLTQMLAQTAKDIFDDFVERVEKDDVTKTVVQDGTVHPLTSYVINYVKFLLDYQITLEQHLEGHDQGDKSSSYLAKSTAKIMQALLSNLDGKAKQYTDPALAHIFLMNNIHYIVRAVRGSEAKELLGDDWIQRHRRLVQQHAQEYQRSGWGKVVVEYSNGLYETEATLNIVNSLQVFLCLSGPGLTSTGSSGMSRYVLKERFRTFYSLFDEVHQRQLHWTIPEVELREEVRLAVAERGLWFFNHAFMFRAILENSKNAEKYIKYTAEDLEQLLLQLFESKKA